MALFSSDTESRYLRTQNQLGVRSGNAAVRTVADNRTAKAFRKKMKKGGRIDTGLAHRG